MLAINLSSMNGNRFQQALFAMTTAALLSLVPPDATATPPRWSTLPALPDAEGFAGMFSGVSGHSLLAAGGANIVGNRWEDPLHKKWYDTVFALDRPDGPWRIAGKLPRPSAYGVSITTKRGIVCIGGCNATHHLSNVFLLSLSAGHLQTTSLPDLPVSAAYACGALAGETLYVAGGLEAPDAPSSLKQCWAMDLREKNPAWKEIAPWPGAGRQKAVAGACGDSFFLFGGVETGRDSEGKPTATFLTDAYCYTPGKGWERKADLPFPAVAAPSPAPLRDGSTLLIIGGDDGAHSGFQPPRDQPEFQSRILAYSVPENRWTVLGTAPFSRVTAPTVSWDGGTAIPSGEIRPRVRSPRVEWLH